MNAEGLRRGFRRQVIISVLLVFPVAVNSLILAGCATAKGGFSGPASDLLVVEARYTHEPLTIDGHLDESAWVTALTYELKLSADKLAAGAKLQDSGTVRFIWGDRFLYVGAEFSDADVAAEGDSDQMPHWQLGDVCELFLMPQEQTWYWEMYATPKGRKSAYWFPGGGRVGLPSAGHYSCGLEVASQVDGSLNDWRDRDVGWTVEMAMPLADLKARGEKLDTESPWRVLVGRYNYTRYLPQT